MQTLLLTYLVGGILLALVSLPLVAEKVKPNPFYGFRVPATLDDPQLWYVTNKYFAKRQFFVALVVIAAAVMLYLVPGINLDVYALSVLGVFAVAFVQSWRYMKSLRWAFRSRKIIVPVFIQKMRGRE